MASGTLKRNAVQVARASASPGKWPAQYVKRTRTLVETKVKASWRTCREVQAFDVILLK